MFTTPIFVLVSLIQYCTVPSVKSARQHVSILSLQRWTNALIVVFNPTTRKLPKTCHFFLLFYPLQFLLQTPTVKTAKLGYYHSCNVPFVKSSSWFHPSLHSLGLASSGKFGVSTLGIYIRSIPYFSRQPAARRCSASETYENSNRS